MTRSILVLVVLAFAGPAYADVGSAVQDPEAICKQALNANPMFAEHLVRTINNQTVQQHIDAADHIAKNELHVIMAYAAMWVVAAGFVIFLWRRQRSLQAEIEMLRHDLDVAAKEAAK